MLNPAGFIDGANVRGETLRRALYVSTGGATGITRSEDLAVYAYATPGTGVRINPGSGVIATKFTDAYAGESYTVSVGAGMNMVIPANNTGSVSRWEIIFSVRDPQFAGNDIPADPTEDSYSDIELVRTLPTTRPFLHLATITLPANTATVTQAMITDRRKLALPRSEREFRSLDVGGAAQANNDKYVPWPGAARWFIDVPEWATRAYVQVNWFGVILKAGWSVTQLSANLGIDQPNPLMMHNTTFIVGTDGGSPSQTYDIRGNLGATDRVSLPASWRGKRIEVAPSARYARGSAPIRLDHWSSVSMDIQFYETP